MREQCEQLHIFGNPSSSFREVNEMDHRTHLDKKFAHMKCQKAGLDESSVPRLVDEAVEVQHVLADPKPDNVSVDGVLSLGKENSWKHLEIEDFYYGFDYVINRNCGALDCNTQGQDVLELGVLDGLLDEVDEVDDIHAANDISGACEDFLLDIELADKICNLEYAPSGRSRVENSSSESQSPGLSGSSNFVLGLSESSSATHLETECKNVSAEKKSVKCELYDSPEDYINYQTLGGDHEFTTSLDLENLDELDDASPLDNGISSDENEKKAVQTSKMGTLLGKRRLRRPTKRYIEEFSVPKSKNALETEQGLDIDLKDECLNVMSSNELHHPREESLSETITQETLEVEDDEKLSDLKSKCLTGRRKISSSAPTIKRIKIGSRNEHHHFKSPKSAPLDESITGTSQEPFNSRLRKGRPKKLPSVSVFDSDDGRSESDSEDDCVKRRSKKSGDRRKHQRMWTLSEVTKLIDGIAQYGTGRWTDIKKLSFSSSAYRTPIDLRDKWRNLLRASSAHKQKLKQNKEDEQKHAIRTLPKTVIRRIRELAILHPYPRFSPGGRYIRRKN